MSGFMSGFQKFCNEEEFHVISGQDLGGCFEQIVCVIPVYLVLFLGALYLIVKGLCRPIRSGTRTSVVLLCIRCSTNIALVVAEVVLFWEEYLAKESFSVVIVVTHCIIMISWLLSVVVIIQWRNSWSSLNTGREPPLLVIAWVLTLLSCSVELHSAILSQLGSASALDPGNILKPRMYNIYARWLVTLLLILLQIPRSHTPANYLNLNSEAGSSRDFRIEAATEENFSLLSRATFHWVNPLFSSPNRYNHVPDLPFTLPASMNPMTVHCQFKMCMSKPAYQPIELQTDVDGEYTDLIEPLLKEADEEVTTPDSPWILIKTLNKAFGWSYWPLSVVKLVSSILGWCTPVLLNLFLKELESETSEVSSAAVYIGVLLMANIAQCFIDNHFDFSMSKLKIRIKAAIVMEVYSKTLSTNLAQLKKFSVGEITNFISADCDRVVDLTYFYDLWYMPLSLGVTIYLLYKFIGLAFLSGLGFCLVLIPLNKWLANKIHKYNTNLMKFRDSRIKLVHEVMTNIRSVKIFNWEEKFIEKIAAIRDKEVAMLRKIAYLDAMCVYFWASAPLLITFAIIVTFYETGGELSASNVFTTLSLVQMMILPLNAFPWVMMGMINGWISVKRLQAYYNLPENSPHLALPNIPFEPTNVVEMDNAGFYWSDRGAPVLKDVSFHAAKGSLSVIMGEVGCGKTSLLLALSQELNQCSGELRLKEWREGAGLVLQDIWIKSGTVRSAILNGAPFDLYWYESVVYACSLDKDMLAFSEGDQTQVGVNGSGLSGGQKIRISLARAVYQNKQVYILDDIFSGLDAAVGTHIYENCIKGLLCNKTIIMATHQPQFAAEADTLMILEGGQVKYIGPPQHTSLGLTETGDSSLALSKDEAESIKEYEEERHYGSVDVTVYKHYSKAAGYVLTVLVLVSMFGMQGTDNLSTWWLSYWIKSVSETPRTVLYLLPRNISSLQGPLHENHSENNLFYLEMYGAIVGTNTVMTLLRAFLFAHFGVKATSALHSNMLKKVIMTTVHFFDKTPLGVILNRFSADVVCCDSSLPAQLNITLAYLYKLIGSVIITCYGVPYVVIILAPLTVVYYFIQRYYRASVREVKRLYALARSPLYSHFEETVKGVVYIHSDRSTDTAMITGLKLLSTYQRTDYCLVTANSWLKLRLQLLGSAVLAITAGVALLEMHHGGIDPALLALSITYALSINTVLAGLVQAISSLEMELIGVERILDYSNVLPLEIDQSDLEILEHCWPTHGKIKLDSVCVKYPDSTTLALNNINVTIHAGEKVGIVGRTGAGKSTLLLALFRLVALERGKIEIDEVDISTISASMLRQRLAMLPQQPFIFSSNVRDNLDPFHIHSDAVLWEVLKRCKMDKVITSLQSEISSDKLSSGEKQLLCLARALLSRAKIFCLDEATASMDIETDSLIQTVIREDFSNSTVIAVAHRIDSVMDFDRILVMSNGSLIEDGAPYELIHDHNSHLYKLARNSGVVPHTNKMNVKTLAQEYGLDED